MAHVGANPPQSKPPDCTQVYGIPTWYNKLAGTPYLNPNTCEINNSAIESNEGEFYTGLIASFVVLLLWLVGVVSVFMIMWGGISFIIADGSPEKIASARKTILNAIIGVTIAMLATMLVSFVTSYLEKP